MPFAVLWPAEDVHLRSTEDCNPIPFLFTPRRRPDNLVKTNYCRVNLAATRSQVPGIVSTGSGANIDTFFGSVSTEETLQHNNWRRPARLNSRYVYLDGVYSRKLTLTPPCLNYGYAPALVPPASCRRVSGLRRIPFSSSPPPTPRVLGKKQGRRNEGADI